MPFFTAPTSFRNANPFTDLSKHQTPDFIALSSNSPTYSVFNKHTSHPDFGHLLLLIFEAVLEVVCVSLPGYIVARQGMFTAEMQKFAANLNVMLFTPCLSNPIADLKFSKDLIAYSFHKARISIIGR